MPFSIRPLLAGVAGVLLLTGQAVAGEVRNFDRGEFDYAQHNGRRVMLVIGSRWDPTGQSGFWAMDNIARDMLYPDVIFFRVDFNRQKDVLRALGVYDDSTVIVFRGTQERGRVSGEIDEEGMRRLLDSAK